MVLGLLHGTLWFISAIWWQSARHAKMPLTTTPDPNHPKASGHMSSMLSGSCISWSRPDRSFRPEGPLCPPPSRILIGRSLGIQFTTHHAFSEDRNKSILGPDIGKHNLNIVLYNFASSNLISKLRCCHPGFSKIMQKTCFSGGP